MWKMWWWTPLSMGGPCCLIDSRDSIGIWSILTFSFRLSNCPLKSFSSFWYVHSIHSRLQDVPVLFDWISKKDGWMDGYHLLRCYHFHWHEPGWRSLLQAIDDGEMSKIRMGLHIFSIELLTIIDVEVIIAWWHCAEERQCLAYLQIPSPPSYLPADHLQWPTIPNHTIYWQHYTKPSHIPAPPYLQIFSWFHLRCTSCAT